MCASAAKAIRYQSESANCSVCSARNHFGFFLCGALCFTAGFTAFLRAAGAFLAEARTYLPWLGSGDVMPAPAGVRAQAVDPDGSLVDDFRIHQIGLVTTVRNAPSPAATASLAIAERIVAGLSLPGQPALGLE